MTPRELTDWLRLLRIPGLGPVRIQRLIHHFGSPRAILAAEGPALAEALGMPPPGMNSKLIEACRQAGRPQAVDAAARDRERLQGLGAAILVRGGAGYPPLLSHIHDPPPLLFVLGDPGALLGTHPIAVVGTRSASPAGLANARALSREMAARGMTVISGLALGVDAAAHQGALDAGGVTVGVLAVGLDIDYPAANRELKRRMVAHGGCLVTEALPGTAARPALFPRRNRLISGLSLGVVVTQARERSGALVTVRLALEQGREVFAVPGPIEDSRSRGCHRLLREGARLVEGVDDIQEELAWSLGPGPEEAGRRSRSAGQASVGPEPPESQPTPSAPVQLPPEARSVLEALAPGPAQGDQLARSCGLTVAALSRILLQLEMAGLAQRLPGNIYALK